MIRHVYSQKLRQRTPTLLRKEFYHISRKALTVQFRRRCQNLMSWMLMWSFKRLGKDFQRHLVLSVTLTETWMMLLLRLWWMKHLGKFCHYLTIINLGHTFSCVSFSCCNGCNPCRCWSKRCCCCNPYGLSFKKCFTTWLAILGMYAMNLFLPLSDECTDVVSAILYYV